MSLRKKTSERFGGGCWKRIHSKKEEGEEERTGLRSVGGGGGQRKHPFKFFPLPCPKHRPARPTMPYDTDKDVCLPRKIVFLAENSNKVLHIFMSKCNPRQSMGAKTGNFLPSFFPVTDPALAEGGRGEGGP